MAAPTDGYSVVLVGRYAGKDRAVAQALAQAFEQEEAWGLPIVEASPISLLTSLELGQAQAVLAALAETEAAGCRFQIQAGVDESCPTVAWSTLARIGGRLVTELVPPRPAAAPAPAGQAATAAAAALTCPHCGKAIEVRLASAGRAAVSPALKPLPATARAEPPEGKGTAPRAPIPIPVPLSALPPFPVPPAPAGGPREKTSSPPLPDIPVPENAPPAQARPAAKASTTSAFNAPVDLATFEAGIRSRAPAQPPLAPSPAPSREPSNPPPPAPPGAAPTPDAEPAPPNDAPAENGGALCSVFIGKNQNPKVHELVAELRGVTPDEAAQLSQKPLVHVAKDILLTEAQRIRGRFADIGVHARIILKR